MGDETRSLAARKLAGYGYPDVELPYAAVGGDAHVSIEEPGVYVLSRENLCELLTSIASGSRPPEDAGGES